MTVEGFDATQTMPTIEKAVKMVQITVMFQTDTDADALSVKTAVSEALKGRKGIVVNFAIHDRPTM
jgi:hypothetical protein